MNNWLNNPLLKNMDPTKLELMKTVAAQTVGKSDHDMAPILLSLITNANKKGIQFTRDEMDLVIDLLKEGKPKKEQIQIDKMLQMARSFLQTQK
ncbi:MAG: hypothetical protein RR791_01975 [Lachnospiraceae bacterium]